MHIEIDRVSKNFGRQTVLSDCSVAIPKGDVLSLLGPSGCGKTTLLRAIAGFNTPDRGSIRIGGQDVTDLPPNQRKVGFVFQHYALFPHLDVRRNVSYGLDIRGVGADQIRTRTDRMLDLVGMSTFAGRYPGQLSGGQQQRVAIARALVLEPEVLLLDEPFNALDAQLRGTMQIELRKLVKRLEMTAIFVTHDQHEALTLSDTLAVMNGGRIEQSGSPLALYDKPQTGFVAGFIGTANMVNRTVEDGVIHIGAVRLSATGSKARAVIRPENIEITPGAASDDWRGKVTFVRPLGPIVEYQLEAGEAAPVTVIALRRAGDDLLLPGDDVTLSVRDPAACTVLAVGDQA
ncbi:MAG: ABC transporter ATP-binding protein [Alphaproteobacteria bacterium]|nr:ABC transporter ATP-binding protein [Alphaproteobacteria bacterium]